MEQITDVIWLLVVFSVELIVAILALLKCELQIVQASLVGSILGNLLLGLGMCFYTGGLKYPGQDFGIGATRPNSSLLTISVIVVLFPAAFHFSVSKTAGAQLGTAIAAPDDDAAILALSHGVAIILLFIYAAYVFFQLYCYPDLDGERGEHNVVPTNAPTFYIPNKISNKMHLHHMHLKRPGNNTIVSDGEAGASSKLVRINVSKPLVSSPQAEGGKEAPLEKESGDVQPAGESSARNNIVLRPILRIRTVGLDDNPHADGDGNGPMSETPTGSIEGVEVEQPMMSLAMAVILLVIVKVILVVTAEFLVDSINGLVEGRVVSKAFAGLVLVPIVGNAAEHITAVTVSVKAKLDLSLGVTVDSSIQIALFVIPFIVTLAWILGKPLPLLFDPYESVALFLCVLTVNYVVQNGKPTWLEGFILICLYIILAVAFWYYVPVGTALLDTCK